jgi:hypothetical protein
VPDTTKRLHYFDHQFLRANDFNDEQTYHVNRLRIHNRALHTPGIAEGLKVIFETGATAVTVQKGTAVDGEGQLIILTEDQRVELGDQAADAAVYITIAYKETQTDISKESDVHDNTRWTEEPDIRNATKRPDNPTMQLILAKVSRAGTTVSAIDEGDRKAAGAASGDISTHGITLMRDGIDPNKWPKLSCSDVNQAALENGSLRIDDGREIFFRDNGQLRSLDNNHRIVFNRRSNRLELYEFGDISFNTGNPQTEKMKILANGNVGIGAGAGGDKLEVGGTLRILTGSNPIRFTSGWSDFPAGAVNQAEISNDASGYKTLMIVGNRSSDAGVRRVSVWDRLEVNGNMLTTGNVQFNGSLSVGGAITPSVGNAADKGIQFPTNPGSGAGDEAFIRYFVTAGETTTLRIGINNDPDDTISFWQHNAERMVISGDNVGIGVMPPTQKLQVNGIIYSDTGGFMFPDKTTQATAAGSSPIPAANVSAGSFGANTGGGAYTFPGALYWGDAATRTETKDDAGVKNSKSGFFQTSAPVNYYAGANSWQHLIESRHTNPANNFALQIAGSFFDQKLYMRKTADNGATAWSQFVLANSAGNVGIGVPDPGFILDVGSRMRIRDGASSAGHWLFQNKLDRSFIGMIDDTHVGFWGSGFGWGINMDCTNGNLGTRGYSPTPKTPGWGGGIHTWDVEAEATIWARNGTQSGPRDLAENYLSADDLTAGDVVCLDTERDALVWSERANDELVVGVISTMPGLLLNSTRDDETFVKDLKGMLEYPLALSGRVPCKVTDENGAIKRGDFLTSSSTRGHAMKALPVKIDGVDIYRPGTIIGKALESFKSGKGMIDVFVFVR